MTDHEQPPLANRIRSEPPDNLLTECENMIRAHEPEALKPPPMTMTDVPRLPRRIFIVFAFLPVMGWTVISRTSEALRSLCVMIRCDWQEDWNDMRKHWKL